MSYTITNNAKFNSIEILFDAKPSEAARILEYLTGEKNSPIYRDGKKQRVPNVYNGGYHYETVYNPERIATIDF
ncbi:MAG: hypothetical protein IIZ93_04420 [Acidaminococcaceae bacterium]|nr:hypothetical protein [Acidaminococcaceae bacterium]